MTIGLPFKIQPSAKLKIIALEPRGTSEKIEAQFNPKEVQIDTSVPWQKQTAAREPAALEYTGGESRTIAVELLFDGAEEARSVRPELDRLHKLTQHIGARGDDRRPPKVMVLWGADGDSEALPQFGAVIESVSVKYQMFSSSGAVLRATATVKLKEAGSVRRGSDKK